MLERIYVPQWKCRDLTASEIERLGVDKDKLADDESRGLFRVTAAKVVWLGSSFDFDETGEMAVSFICRNEIKHVADMAAWSPKDGRLGVWRGAVSMLGEENAFGPRMGGDALRVYPSPREWLAAGRDGVVIIDARAALPVLYAATPILVFSLSQRQELMKAWQSKIPEVLIHGQPQGLTIVGGRHA